MMSAVLLGCAGCQAFNPAFLEVVSGGQAPSLGTIPNAPGHVVIALVNKTTVDERLISYLAPKIPLTAVQIRDLRPRVRMRVRITYVDGTTQVVELVDGSREFVDPAFNAAAVPDLNQNDLTNVVAQCDVASVEIEPGTTVDVFIPVELTAWELVEIEQGGTVSTVFQPRTRSVPQFRALLPDEVDDDGNVLTRRNIGVRDTVVPTDNVICGSVVAITMNGSPAVPFLDAVPNNADPSYDQNDQLTLNSIGGRFEFEVLVR